MKKIFFAIITCVFLLSCDKKEIQVDRLNFDVSVDRQNYKVNDSVVFNFRGDSPDIITFYSGESINDYAYLGIDKYVDSKIFSQFTSAKLDPHADPNLRQLDMARIKYSTDFNGNYTEGDINMATWTDITERFYLPPPIAGQTNLQPSGRIDVTDLFENSSQPVYLGFFYETELGKGRTNFRFQSFIMESIVPEVTNISNRMYDMVSAEFKLVLGSSYSNVALADNRPFINYNASSQPTFITFRAPPGITQPARKAYAITRALVRPELTNIGSAVGLGIKSFSSPELSSYTHIFNEPGNYLVTFVVQNTNIYGSKKEVKQIEIVVED